MPKQEGHATMARREPQCEHEVASGATGAPHEGQFRVSGVAGMAGYYIGGEIFASPCGNRVTRRRRGHGASQRSFEAEREM